MKATKSILLLAVFTLAGMFTFAQSESGFGIKAGFNYNGNGDYFESINAAAQEPSKNAGFHAGIYYKLKLLRVYVKPELFYTSATSDYENDSFKMSNIGPVHVFAGPAFQYILNTEYEDITIEDVEKDFSVGAHFGAGVNLGKLGIDLRYERGFGENEARFINTNITELPQSRLDTRPEQLILSLSYKI